VVMDLQEKHDGDVNTGGDWATGLAINHNSDAYTWDCDGLGVGLNRQVTKAFKGKKTTVSMFRGSEGVDRPEAIYEPTEGTTTQGQKTNKDALKNKRAQYYDQLRKRVYTTYRAVAHGEYKDPDDMISFDSTLALLPKLRSELCRMPIKPNGAGKFDLYTKQEMKAKYKFDSPNLGDSVMMLTRTPPPDKVLDNVMPQPIRTLGRTR